MLAEKNTKKSQMVFQLRSTFIGEKPFNSTKIVLYMKIYVKGIEQLLLDDKEKIDI